MVILSRLLSALAMCALVAPIIIASAAQVDLGLLSGSSMSRAAQQADFIPIVTAHSPALHFPLTRRGGPAAEVASTDASGKRTYGRRRETKPGNVNQAELAGCPFSIFTVPVRIGNTIYDLLVDTGSSTLAVAGSSCSGCVGVSPLWQSGSTGSLTSTPVTSTYGDGSGWQGRIASDDVSITPDLSAPSQGTSAVRMSIAVIDGQAGSTPFFSKHSCQDDSQSAQGSVLIDGILGFGYPSLAKAGTESFIDRLFAEHPTVPKTFAIQMCEYGGNLWIGGTDASKYSGQMQYTPITDSAYYSVDPHDIGLVAPSGSTSWMGYQLSDWTANGRYVNVIDSGTTLWQLPSAIYDRVIAAISADPAFQLYFRTGGGNDFFDNPSGTCESSRVTGVSMETLQQQLPKLTLKLTSGLTVTLPAVGSYLLPCTAAYNSFLPGVGSYGDGGMLAGWSFLSQLVVQFDLDQKRIGFAASEGCQLPGASSTRAKVEMGSPVSYGGSGGSNSGGTTNSGGSTVITVSSIPVTSGSDTPSTTTPDSSATPATSTTPSSSVASSTGSTAPIQPPNLSGFVPIVVNEASATGGQADQNTTTDANPSGAIINPTSPSTPVGDQSTAAFITLATTYSYSAFTMDPAKFERSFLSDLRATLGWTNNERIGALREQKTEQATTTTTTQSNGDSVLELHTQLANSSSRLRQGDVTDSVHGMDVAYTRACPDGTWQTECGNGSGMTFATWWHWWVILLLVLCAIIFLSVVAGLVYFCWYRRHATQRQDKTLAHPAHPAPGGPANAHRMRSPPPATNVFAPMPQPPQRSRGKQPPPVDVAQLPIAIIERPNAREGRQ